MNERVKGMPYTSKFPSLGDTNTVRVPKMCKEHFLYLCNEYDRISESHGEEYAKKVMKLLESKAYGYCR